MRRYFARKLLFYAVTFWVAVTIDWLIPRFAPGDPVRSMVARMAGQPEAAEAMTSYFNRTFGLDVPPERSIPKLASIPTIDCGS